MSDVELELRRHRGNYGFDGNWRMLPPAAVAALVAVVWVALAAFTVVNIVAGNVLAAAVVAYFTFWLLLSVCSYLYTTRVGKFRVWARLLTGLALRGDEHLLDLGCGRGAVLLAAAKLLPRGRAVGVDLWTTDQSGNAPEVTLRNAEAEGVAERVEVRTGDIRRLPFGEGSFDVVVSSLAVHNIPDAAGRLAAIDEAVRVLRPGGRLVIADIRHGKQYAARLRDLGLADAQSRDLGPRMWWAGPWVATQLVTATKNA